MQEKPRSSLSFAERLKKWYRDRQDDAQVIDYVVETVEPKIKDVRGYRQSLRQPLELCLQYCKTMITQIPGPIYLKPPNYYADPLINAAFVGSEKIEDLLARPGGQDTRAGPGRLWLFCPAFHDQNRNNNIWPAKAG